MQPSSENDIRASAGMACYFLENHSRIARLKQPSFENLENAVSRGGSLRKAAPLLGIESLNVLYFPFSEATPTPKP